jgi:hypothetical protein
MEILRVPTSVASYKLLTPIEVVGPWEAIATASSDSSEYSIDGIFADSYSINEQTLIYTVETSNISEVSLQYLPKVDDEYDIVIKTGIQQRIPIVVQQWNSSSHRLVMVQAELLKNQNSPLYADFILSQTYIEAKEIKEYLDGLLQAVDQIALEDNFTHIRPYVDPSTKGSTASDIAAYSANEEIARAIIDSIIQQGFYYKRKVLHFTGTGSDYLPIWDDVKKVISVYENNKLVEDREYEVTSDKTAIVEKSTDNINRAESAPLVLPAASSDSLDPQFIYRGFGKTWDYLITVEHGYANVPSDIVKATEMLIHDLECGKLDYYKRFISSYNTDQYRIQFDKGLFEGTGNIIVDKILSKYRKSITSIGVL